MLSPSFQPAHTNYTAVMPSEQATSSIRATCNGTYSSLTINGEAVVSGALSTDTALSQGSYTAFSVVVTAENTSHTLSYVVWVYRLPSNNAALSNLELPGIDMICQGAGLCSQTGFG